jgi:RNA polymerase sigma factor (sigma-70 family)
LSFAENSIPSEVRSFIQQSVPFSCVGEADSVWGVSLNDSALVDGLRRHDPEAVRYLSETCLPSVWRYVCARLSSDRHLAEDIVSESVLALLKAVADPALEIGNVLSWLRSVASNKIVDHFRAAARVQHLIEQAKQSMPLVETNDATQHHVEQEQREEVRRVLEMLPEQTRTAMEWKYIDKVSVREISQRMRITEKAVESILFRGRREMRERMMLIQKSEERPGTQTGCSCSLDRGLADRDLSEMSFIKPEPIESVCQKQVIHDD